MRWPEASRLPTKSNATSERGSSPAASRAAVARMAGSVRYGTTPSQITSAGSARRNPPAASRSIGSSRSKSHAT
jgi:hypothetical protein